MRAVDTNVLVRLLIRDDPAQVAAAEAFVEPGAWVSHLVLIEAAWVLDSVYGIEPMAMARALEMLLDQETLAIEDADVVKKALDRYRKRPSLGFSDCLILEVAHRAGHLPLGTFDRELGKQDGAQKL